MSNFINQNSLRDDQYKDSSNLNARIQLHARFSVNKYGWTRFVFDRLADLPPDSRILEIGCGPALLWRVNQARIPEGWDITLSDFSSGMLEDAKRGLAGSSRPFNFEVVDAQEIPFGDATFDSVIANHMLYHVPDRPKAISEINRVLKPGGRFLAATNGQNHMRELWDLGSRFGINLGFSVNDPVLRAFSLENGQAQIAQSFPNVTLQRFEDALEITEVQPILDYVLSTKIARSMLDREKLAEVTKYLEQEIAAKGTFHITKDTGLFMVVK